MDTIFFILSNLKLAHHHDYKYIVHNYENFIWIFVGLCHISYYATFCLLFWTIKEWKIRINSNSTTIQKLDNFQKPQGAFLTMYSIWEFKEKEERSLDFFWFTCCCCSYFLRKSSFTLSGVSYYPWFVSYELTRNGCGTILLLVNEIFETSAVDLIFAFSSSSFYYLLGR